MSKWIQNTPNGVLPQAVKSLCFVKSFFIVERINNTSLMKSHRLPCIPEIIYLKGVINYTEFHLTNGRKMVTCTTLKKHEAEYDGFLRVSRSHLLNPHFISKFDQNNHEILLKGGLKVKVSRRKNSLVSRVILGD